MSDLMFRPVDELAGLVRSGELSARELVQDSLDAIEALNPELNAFVDVLADDALATADAIGPDDPRPFAGVPIAIKNNRAVAGQRLTYSAELMGDYRPDYDHNVVARLRAAGFVIVGTTAIPEWGILPWTNTRRFGPTRNPWDPARVSGGSSGGSATAVAAGMVPIAHGNDGGGSTRIPAACCGLVGLKPQRNRISWAPEVGENFLTVDGVLTRTVAETAAGLDVLAGYEVGDANWAPPPSEPFAATAERAPSGLRIAMTVTPPLATEVDPRHVEAVRDTAALLESLGHHVEEADPPWSQDGLLQTFTAVFGPLVCLQIAQASLISGRQPAEDDMEPVSWALWSLAGTLTAIENGVARAQLEILARALTQWMDPYDAVLTPSLAAPPLELDSVHWQTDDPMGLFRRSGEFTPFTATANITGQPAISLPLHHSEDGLPIGSQLFGRPAGEGPLLALAAQLEQARPWADRRPALATAS
jgi:amidase